MQSGFSLEQLKTFVLVAEVGSFSQAGRKLGKAQSAVSLQIQNLELDLNIQLFDRSGRYPKLTPEGEVMLEEARYMLARARHMNDLATSLQRHRLTELVIAADEMALQPDFDPILCRLAGAFPQLKVTLRYPVLADVAHTLQAEQAHFGISLHMPRQYGDLEVLQYQPTRLIYVAAAGHPLAQEAMLTVDQLSRHRQILVSARNQQGSDWQAAPSCWFVENIWGAVELCKTGVGWTIVPQYAARNAIAEGKLVHLQATRGKFERMAATDLLWPRQYRRDPVVKWLVAAFTQSKSAR
ncbi:LysR family transcriptional regulator [Aliiglaciecola sp. CAU 1673]|uniref:LysR family transcriptional regulator n=1 Tax=Aliiglaciecola sp. CAU 1673 TaxID=3032595 RepID=UPI0023DCD927|nr:LysR family transcriptional regulator [Aliiglaciecola sp. CAU 1673]MDF2178485.1 LysR family transcriptional regulator [Aliiglaciecola sp. CAU 1673]